MKMKIFAVVMAVMLCMSCMCVTAFAADIYVQNGVEFTGSYYSDSDWTVLKVEPDVTYTITIDADISELNVVYCYDGYIGNRTLKFVDGVCEYTCDDASMTGIALHSPTGGDAITFTVTWPQPSPIETLAGSAGEFAGGIFGAFGSPILSFVVSHALTLVPALIGLAILGIMLVKRFIYGA